MSAMLPLQVAAYERCVGDAALMARLPGGVHDGEAPADVSPPYMVIGEKTEVPRSFFAHDGHEDTVQFHIWSAHKGDRECLEILALLDAALKAPLVVAGHGTARLRREFASTMTDEGMRHLPARYRALVLAG